MRERLKRRKQQSPAAKPTQETAQEPLQPAYFNAEDSKREDETVPEQTSDKSEQQVSAASTEESPSSTPAESTGNAPDRSRRRRRRGRGGRGRNRTETPVQPAPMREQEGEAGEPASTAPAAPAAQTLAIPQKPKGIVVLAIGLPGSGKSSWFKRHNIRPLSSDLLREILFDDATEQRFQDLVFSNLRSMLKARLIARRPMNYVDATNLSPHERHTWIKMAHDYGYEVQAVFFDVPLEVCMERNERRKRIVAQDVMHRMAGKLRAPKFEEGFSKITVVRVKKKDTGSEPLIAD